MDGEQEVVAGVQDDELAIDQVYNHTATNVIWISANTMYSAFPLFRTQALATKTLAWNGSNCLSFLVLGSVHSDLIAGLLSSVYLPDVLPDSAALDYL